MCRVKSCWKTPHRFSKAINNPVGSVKVFNIDLTLTVPKLDRNQDDFSRQQRKKQVSWQERTSSFVCKKYPLQHFDSCPKHGAQLENVQCAENHSESHLWKVYPYITWSAQPFQHSLRPLQFSQGWEHGVSRDKAGPAPPQAAFPMEFSTINTPAPENPSQGTQPVSLW